jgi:fructokinase
MSTNSVSNNSLQLAPPVLCVGEILFDRIADHPAEDVEAVTAWHCYPGGAPANVACALVKLGTGSGFLGCIGADEAGQDLRRLLLDIGVNLTGLQVHPTAPTRVVDVLRNAQGERRFAGFQGRSTFGFADAFFQGDVIPDRCFDSVKLLVTGTLGLAAPQSAQGLEIAIQRARLVGAEIVVDVNWRPMFWETIALGEAIARIRQLLTQAHWLKLTDEEADLLFQSQDLAQIQTFYPALKGILLTAGPAGCHYWIECHQGYVPAFTVDSVDTTGAGDGFLAGFLHQLLSHDRSQLLQNPQHCQAMVTYASAVGALTTLSPGAIDPQPSAQDVTDFLQTA